MTIAIYADTLRVFTSMKPQRGLFKEFLLIRSDDYFIFYVNSKFASDPVITSFFDELAPFNNWRVEVLKFPHLLNRIFQVLGMSFPKLPAGADIYISPDVETFGQFAKPVVNFLPDLTVFDDVSNTSLSLFNSYFRRWCILKMARRTNKVIVVSEFTRTRYLHHFPHSSSKVEVIYNGIEEQWFDQKIVHIDDSPQYWIWMGGSYNSRKNLDRLFFAYKSLKNEKSDLPKIMIVGVDAASITRLTAFLSNNQMLDDVIIKGKIGLNDLISLVDNSKGLLFPSLYEGFGLPVIESFARSKPVLCSNVTSLPEISNGLSILCDPFRVPSIKEGLIEMLNAEQENLVKMREWASGFRYGNSAQKFDELLKIILKTDRN